MAEEKAKDKLETSEKTEESSNDNFPVEENLVSLCVSCNKKDVCYKRRSLLESLSAVRKTFGVAHNEGYGKFKCEALVSVCEHYTEDTRATRPLDSAPEIPEAIKNVKVS